MQKNSLLDAEKYKTNRCARLPLANHLSAQRGEFVAGGGVYSRRPKHAADGSILPAQTGLRREARRSRGPLQHYRRAFRSGRNGIEIELGLVESNVCISGHLIGLSLLKYPASSPLL